MNCWERKICYNINENACRAGAELWASNGVGLLTVTGQLISNTIPNSINFGIWWDVKLLRELLDHTGGTGKIDKWNYDNGGSNQTLAYRRP
ncbi:rhamnogalacturonan lyase family protein [Xylanibacillus composti]|uniref:Rhamnogalacturonan lyase family 11 C-terminal domain-containing protein n=1 Tax=Xylanibacillus composti TaxID=1572762 RepID=A0A8J4H238_9BACL|nr:hypothetical protein XYCOK13_10000 [Xylanibacillus composti]